MMVTKENVLAAVASEPSALRQLLRDRKVVAALESLGVLLTIFELHAPSAKAKSAKGLGPTLCNYRGRRHPKLVTCKKCLAKIKAGASSAE